MAYALRLIILHNLLESFSVYSAHIFNKLTAFFFSMQSSNKSLIDNATNSNESFFLHCLLGSKGKMSIIQVNLIVVISLLPL